MPSTRSRGKAASYSTIGPSTVTSMPLDFSWSQRGRQNRQVLVLPRRGEEDAIDLVVSEKIAEDEFHQIAACRRVIARAGHDGRTAKTGGRLHEVDVRHRERKPGPQMRGMAVTHEQVIRPRRIGLQAGLGYRAAAGWSTESSARCETRPTNHRPGRSRSRRCAWESGTALRSAGSPSRRAPTVAAIVAEVAPKIAVFDVPFARVRNGVSTSFQDK